MIFQLNHLVSYVMYQGTTVLCISFSLRVEVWLNTSLRVMHKVHILLLGMNDIDTLYIQYVYTFC